MLSRKLVGMSAALAVSVAILHAGAAVASAGPDNRPVRLWSFSAVKQGIGKVKLAAGSQQGGLLRKQRTFGGAAFAFPESIPQTFRASLSLVAHPRRR